MRIMKSITIRVWEANIITGPSEHSLHLQSTCVNYVLNLEWCLYVDHILQLHRYTCSVHPWLQTLPYHTPLKDWYPIKEVDHISPTYLSCTIILKVWFVRPISCPFHGVPIWPILWKLPCRQSRSRSVAKVSKNHTSFANSRQQFSNE